MSVKVTRPAEWARADLVEVESDAPSNEAAIIEIETWAAQAGLLRTRENWLATTLKNGKRHFRAICYRPSEEEVAAVEHRIRLREERLAGPSAP